MLCNTSKETVRRSYHIVYEILYTIWHNLKQFRNFTSISRTYRTSCSQWCNIFALSHIKFQFACLKQFRNFASISQTYRKNSTFSQSLHFRNYHSDPHMKYDIHRGLKHRLTIDLMSPMLSREGRVTCQKRYLPKSLRVTCQKSFFCSSFPVYQ